MRHLVVSEYGQFLGVTGERAVVYEGNKITVQIPLRRLSTISVIKEGVSFSSNLLLQCSARGIKFFIMDELGRDIVCLSGSHQHAIASLREKQFQFIASLESHKLAKNIVISKIKAQRNILNYFYKYEKKSERDLSLVPKNLERLKYLTTRLQEHKFEERDKWRSILMGHEGVAARCYWNSLGQMYFNEWGFKGRKGRGAEDIANKCLNYGYAILATQIWTSLVNSGLEVYAGFFHTQRPGKPSLVLDMMEEFRPWVVDRNIIKLRNQFNLRHVLTKPLKQAIIESIHSTLQNKHVYNGKNVSLYNILQRQSYRLCGIINQDAKYRSFKFKW